MSGFAELDPAISERLERLEALVDEFEVEPDEELREQVFELLQCVDYVHRAGLQRLMTLIETADPALQRRLGRDPAVRLLFELYDLLPEPAENFIPLETVEVLPPRSAAR